MRGKVSKKLEPFLNQVNQAIADMKGAPYEVETTRTNLNNLANLMPQGPEIAKVTSQSIDHHGYSIPLRIYHPQPDAPLPVLLHFHGGGHMCGSIELYDPISRFLADGCQCIVIAVDYRLAPEFPYPIGLTDCEFVLKNISQVLLGINYLEKVFIVGDSAGGAICSSLAMKSQFDIGLKIDKQVLIYPSVDYTMTSESFEQNGQGFLLEKEKIDWYFHNYFQHDMALERLKKASPLHNELSSKLPSTLVITAGCDPLRDEGLMYVESAKNSGADIEHHHFKDMIHAYMLLHDLVEDECIETYALIAEFIKK
ncbi:alpha/beta hydrolase [Thalassotalea loyana]|uniref:Alpha/beta hydrolase n=1 Tax=Thalassotalea loyana TaxID=280483 RepID=A0ABQ6HHL6_9GAMM|nr:alpha/beta hydrolase [Thalassotalea loyana]GLX87127.1 alpha/beta hydrolase [Thalassotalea loyana]